MSTPTTPRPEDVIGTPGKFIFLIVAVPRSVAYLIATTAELMVHCLASIASTDNTIVLITVNPNLKGSAIEEYFKMNAPGEWGWTDYLVSVRYADQGDESMKLSCFAKYVASLQTIRTKNESVADHATARLKQLMDPAIAPVHEADGGGTQSPDFAVSNSAKDASNGNFRFLNVALPRSAIGSNYRG